MTKVYVVTTGHGSFYKIRHIFSTEEQAEEYLLDFEDINDRFYAGIRIEEHELDPEPELTYY